eukprot:m.10833 g.10833  ORF g.10833 m.10833 type:complete len:409 (-) comp4362_c1_seq1:124-1350(-)
MWTEPSGGPKPPVFEMPRFRKAITVSERQCFSPVVGIAMKGAMIVVAMAVGAAARSTSQQTGCATDLECSLNGKCVVWSGVCECDAPWTGPSCGVLKYKTTPISGKSLYPESDPHNTWNGAIIRGTDGVYHLYDPIYPPGSLGGTNTMLHGTSTNITGPYAWGVHPNITLTPTLGPFNGPKSVVFPDPETNRTMYSLWLGGGVYLASDPAGPFTKLEGFSYPGANPAPVWHDGAFYANYLTTIYTTPRLVSGAKWTEYGTVNRSTVPPDWLPEDPDMWVDPHGNWHIINHCYDNHEWENCSTSVLSSHFFSPDGKTWHFLNPPVQPYSHTVQYDDGSSHMFVTMERPNVFLDESGQVTHIHLAADLVTGDEGCGNDPKRQAHAHFGHVPCDNCKYDDHGGTTIIALDV